VVHIKITRTSLLSGKTRTLALPVTEEELRRAAGSELIQDALPHLTDSQREFILSGITDDEWDEAFQEEEEEVDGDEAPF
jgi:hypothetical protein